MKRLHVVCKATGTVEHYRITEDERQPNSSKYIVTLDRLGPDGWHTLEQERCGLNETYEVVQLQYDRISDIYGAPQYDRVRPLRSYGIVGSKLFENRFDFRGAEIDYTEITDPTDE